MGERDEGDRLSCVLVGGGLQAQQEEEPAAVVDAEEKEEAAPEVSVGTEQPEVGPWPW